MTSIVSGMGHDYEIEEKMQRTLHFTPHMMQDKAFFTITQIVILESYPKNFKQVKYFENSYGFSKFGIAFQSLGEVKWTSTSPRKVHDYDID